MSGPCSPMLSQIRNSCAKDKGSDFFSGKAPLS